MLTREQAGKLAELVGNYVAATYTDGIFGRSDRNAEREKFTQYLSAVTEPAGVKVLPQLDAATVKAGEPEDVRAWLDSRRTAGVMVSDAADEARLLIVDFESLSVEAKTGSWCQRVLSFLRRTAGVTAIDGGQQT